MNAQSFLELIHRADNLEKADFLLLKKIQKNFPYFQIPFVLGTRFEQTKQCEKHGPQLSFAALTSPDRVWLKKWLERPLVETDPTGATFELLPGTMNQTTTPSTWKIESPKELDRNQKDHIGDLDPKPAQAKRPKPNEDLIETIKRKEKKQILDQKKQEQIDLIKAFSKKEIKKATIKEIEANQNTENLAESSTKLNDNLITETFAKILLRQGKKDVAIEIYKKLSLKFPDKRTYFADLIEKTKE